MKKKICLLGVIVNCICIVVSLLPKVEIYSHAYRCKVELYKVKSKIDVTDNKFKGLELLESDLNNNEIFLSGEAHGSIKSINMNFYLFKYFIEKIYYIA